MIKDSSVSFDPSLEKLHKSTRSRFRVVSSLSIFNALVAACRRRLSNKNNAISPPRSMQWTEK